MAVPTLANTWRVTVKYHAGLTHFENVMHVTADDGSTEQDVADDFGAAWMDSTSLADVMSNLVVGDHMSVQHYDGVSAPVDVVVGGFTGVAMGGSSSPVPAAVAGCITLNSGMAGRSNRGRIYLGGLSDVYVDSTGAQWASGAFPTLELAATSFKDLLVGGGVTSGLDVYSALHNTKAPVINVIFRRYMGTQRRRAEQQI